VLETDGTNTLHYTYSTTGQLVSININGTEYGYLFNAQGDVVGLIDGTGTQVVAYTYDAYGNILSTTGTLKDTVGKLNPYRYRSYRSDSETNLYYLQARYYNPDWGRFLNTDGIIGLNSVLLTNNMFIYCVNNPVNLNDPSGYASIFKYLKYPGEIHRAVQNDMKKRFPRFKFEAVLINNKRVDVLNPKNGRIWEIKPCTYSMSKASNQLEGYLGSNWKENTNLKLKKGKYISGNTFEHSNPFSVFTVRYWYERDGVILYTFEGDVNQKTMRVLVALSVTAICYGMAAETGGVSLTGLAAI
jgi:RHS repeat-associated protein